ncbi:MAG: hypothetical protein E6X86_04935 [Clostridium butyricum]|nr:hypothetical protein [Clostridium butyricum]MDU4853563.1 hypothetical protein [Clostridioides difficile]
MNNFEKCHNSIKVIGTLKSKSKTSIQLNDGKELIKINLIVASNILGIDCENSIIFTYTNPSSNCITNESLFKSLKSIDDNGSNNANRIEITGSLTMNEFFGTKTNKLITRNQLKANSISIINNDIELEDEAGVEMDCIVTGIIDEVDKKTNTPTGRKKVEIITIGYNSSIHEIQNVFVEKDLAQQFVQIYPVNTFGRLYLKVLNYLNHNNIEEKPNLAFGSPLTNSPEVLNTYTNEVIIIGGDVPNKDKTCSLETINALKKQRESLRQQN